MARINVIIRELNGEKVTHEQLNNIGGNRTVEELVKLGDNAFNRQLAEMVDRTVHRKYGGNVFFANEGAGPNGYALTGRVFKKLHGMERYAEADSAIRVNVSFVTEDGTKLNFREIKKTKAA